MAEIVFGVGSSHSPMLGTNPAQWDLRAKDDVHFPSHPFRLNVYRYDDLVELRKHENMAAQITMAVWNERHQRNQKNLDLIGRKIIEAKLDILVVIGDDQREVFLEDNSPAFVIYTGDTVLNKALDPERLKRWPPGVVAAAWTNQPEKHDVEYPGAPELAHHLVVEAMAEGFDVSVSERMPDGPHGEQGIPHAFGFIYHRILNDLRAVPAMATLPIFINTFYPPNQPSAQRVLQFGKAVGRAIRSWPSKKRVGIAASGGFSHFVIDEELDRRLLRALEENDEATLISEPELNYQSGTSEIKNWIAVCGMMNGTGLRFRTVDYVPCYRSLAGTGNANTFGTWS